MHIQKTFTSLLLCSVIDIDKVESGYFMFNNFILLGILTAIIIICKIVYK